MSIATAITNAQNKVAAAYTSVNTMGGTMPATQNLTNLATAISTIPSGGSSEKYGATIDTLLGDIDSNNVLHSPTEERDIRIECNTVSSYALNYKFSRTGIKSIRLSSQISLGEYALAYICYGCPKLTNVVLMLPQIISTRSLTNAFEYCTLLSSVSPGGFFSVSGNYGLYGAFKDCPSIESFTVNATSVSGNYGLNSLLYRDTSLTSLDISELVSATGTQALGYLVWGCSNLPTIRFSSLNNISGNAIFLKAFVGCKKISNIYYSSLKTTSFGSYVNQFDSMFDSNTATTSGTCTMHFPSNLQSKISSLTGYPNFGATSGRLILAFDLPATS